MKWFKPHTLVHKDFIIEVDGIKYNIHTLNYHMNQGYARCVIEDMSTKNRYYVHNREVINGHIFYVTWNEVYNYARDNYVPGQDMTIYVDQEPDTSPLPITNAVRNNSNNIRLTIS